MTRLQQWKDVLNADGFAWTFRHNCPRCPVVKECGTKHFEGFGNCESMLRQWAEQEVGE